THSATFPDISWSPRGLGGKVPGGFGRISSKGRPSRRWGVGPAAIVIPSCASPFSVAYRIILPLALAAYSHCASVGRVTGWSLISPTHWQKAIASVHDATAGNSES